MNRQIIHIDMDAFYASVEQLDDPQLLNKPVIVGGSPNARGVVSAASYAARKFGVHSAMPMAKAVKLCPQAVIKPVRMARYQEISQQIHNIFICQTLHVKIPYNLINIKQTHKHTTSHQNTKDLGIPTQPTNESSTIKPLIS